MVFIGKCLYFSSLPILNFSTGWRGDGYHKFEQPNGSHGHCRVSFQGQLKKYKHHRPSQSSQFASSRRSRRHASHIRPRVYLRCDFVGLEKANIKSSRIGPVLYSVHLYRLMAPVSVTFFKWYEFSSDFKFQGAVGDGKSVYS